jgi:anti-sigma regulatory factor (Ser/Thr protein kinase)
VVELKSSGPPDVRLGLENQAENVALVRQALGGIAAAVRMDDALLADVKTAVSEACNNVVVHAYAGDRGPMEVYASPDGRELTVVVRDAGQGIQPRQPEPDATMQGVGLSLIQALTKKVEFGGGIGEGTEVRMVFEAPADLELGGIEAVEVDANDNGQVVPPDAQITVSACGLLTGPVLSGVIGMVAARSGFSVERLSDAQILSDAIAAHGHASYPGRHVHVAIDSHEHELRLRLAPLVEEGGTALVRASGIGGLEPLLERLSDELEIERSGEREELLLTLQDPHSG